jgi:hypothetical protein
VEVICSEAPTQSQKWKFVTNSSANYQQKLKKLKKVAGLEGNKKFENQEKGQAGQGG